jgi:hypothetical protein
LFTSVTNGRIILVAIQNKFSLEDYCSSRRCEFLNRYILTGCRQEHHSSNHVETMSEILHINNTCSIMILCKTSVADKQLNKLGNIYMYHKNYDMFSPFCLITSETVRLAEKVLWA